MARREQQQPLFSVQVQLWVREMSRVLRVVSDAPEFQWLDSGPVGSGLEEADGSDGDSDDEHKGDGPAGADPRNGNRPRQELPAVYCRSCGASGWMALRSPITSRLRTKPGAIHQAALAADPDQCALLRARAGSAVPDVRYYNPANSQLGDEPVDGAVSVLVTADEDAARRSACPACGEWDAIRFLGLRVASLASVALSTLFGSSHVELEQRKLIAFTDSVQDASHRAAFFSARTYRFNLRSLMSGAIAEEGGVAEGGARLADLGEHVMGTADSWRSLHGLVPPDLARHGGIRSVWSGEPTAEGRALLARRLAFEAHLEFGLRSRVGRTLELVGAAAATVVVPGLDVIASLLVEKIAVLHGEIDDTVRDAVRGYLQGLLERLRLRGGISHPFLAPYVENNGRPWHVWGGRPEGLPPFPRGQSRPIFMTTASDGDFDSLVGSQRPTWIVDWASRTLGLSPGHAATANRTALSLLSSETEAVHAVTTGPGRQVYGLNPRGGVGSRRS